MAYDVNENLVIKVAGEQAGGNKGQVILDSVTFGGERDNTIYHGIGNDEPQDIGHGNKTYTLSTEQIASEAAVNMIDALVANDAQPDEAEVRVVDDNGDIAHKVNIGKIDWNSFDYDASDGGDFTISLECDCRDVDFV